jgi:hypothetical protein
MACGALVRGAARGVREVLAESVLTAIIAAWWPGLDRRGGRARRRT